MNTQDKMATPRKSCDLMNFCEMPPTRFPTLNVVNERFIRLFRMNISNALREVAAVTVKSVSSSSFEEFTKTQNNPTFFSILTLEKLQGNALFSLDRNLLYFMIDLFFGGRPRPSTSTVNKEVSAAEVNVAKEVLEKAIVDYNEAWAPVYEIGATLRRMEINPLFIGIVPTQENTLVTSLDISFAGVSGTMSIVLPYVTVFPARDRLIWQ